MAIEEDTWNEKSEFEEYIEKVYDFLNKNYPKAYTSTEVSDAVGIKKSKEVIGYDWAFWTTITKRLKDEHKIESKIINGEMYYRVKK